MKKIYYILFAFLILSSCLQAQENKYTELFTQADKAFDSIYKTEEWKNKYAKASREAADETNLELAEEMEELTSVPQALISRISPNSQPGSHIITNHPELPGLLTGFYDSARYYKVDYAEQLLGLKKVILVRADLNFLGGVVEINGGKEIWINSILAIQYPNLFKVIFTRQMGILYGLEEVKEGAGLQIMSTRWELSPRYELWAYNQSQRPSQRQVFFEKLAKKHPLERKL